MTGHLAGGVPNALRVLRTIFLPTNRLPIAPTMAPIPIGSILPNSSALRRSANRLTARLSNREFNCASAGIGTDATPSDSHAPLRPARTEQFADRVLAVVADQHGQHQGATSLPVLGRDAVHRRDRQREERGGLEEHRRLPGGSGQRGKCAEPR